MTVYHYIALFSLVLTSLYHCNGFPSLDVYIKEYLQNAGFFLRKLDVVSYHNNVYVFNQA